MARELLPLPSAIHPPRRPGPRSFDRCPELQRRSAHRAIIPRSHPFLRCPRVCLHRSCPCRSSPNSRRPRRGSSTVDGQRREDEIPSAPGSSGRRGIQPEAPGVHSADARRCLWFWMHDVDVQRSQRYAVEYTRRHAYDDELDFVRDQHAKRVNEACASHSVLESRGPTPRTPERA